jgi:hypothetical protein
MMLEEVLPRGEKGEPGAPGLAGPAGLTVSILEGTVSQDFKGTVGRDFLSSFFFVDLIYIYGAQIKLK